MKKLKSYYHRNLPIRQAICLRVMCCFQGNDIWLGQRTNFGGGIEQWPYKMMVLLNQQNVQSPHFGRGAHFELFYCVSAHPEYVSSVQWNWRGKRSCMIMAGTRRDLCWSVWVFSHFKITLHPRLKPACQEEFITLNKELIDYYCSSQTKRKR